MRVLYVDDDRVNSLLFAELCRMATGVTVEAAGTAAEALELLERMGVDLLVLDLHLPDGDGFSLLPQARAAGFEACWSKPLDVPLVLAALRRHAERSGEA